MITKKRLVTLAEFIYSFMKKLEFDHVSSFAGNAALFILMSFFPMVMYMVSMFKFLPLDAGMLSSYILNIMPEALTPLYNQVVEEVYSISTTSMIRSFTMLVTLYCASKGVYAVIVGMNAVYGIRESRVKPLLYLLAIAYMIVFFVMLGLTMVLIVLGNNIFNTLLRFLPQLAAFHGLFKYGKYIGMLVILVFFFLLMYMNIPNRKSKLRYEITGAVFSAVAWLVFSWAFSFYITNFAHYSVTYGSLATTVIFILWLYGTMNIVFIGAEINVVLRKYAEYGYNHRRVYDYYMEEYQGDLKLTLIK